MFDCNQPLIPANKMYYPELMKVGDREQYHVRLRDCLKTALWRVNKRLGYKYKIEINGKKMIVERVS